MTRRVYRTVSVKQVSLSEALQGLAGGPVWAGVDVAKGELVTVLRDRTGRFLKPWKAKQPAELRDLAGLLAEVGRQRPLVVAMESTGTYGDAFRQALTEAAVAVERVSGKAVKDYAEVFDGVPSNHDGKDAAIVAELASLGKSRPWPHRPRSEWEGEVAYWVEWLDAQQQIRQTWLGRLEGLLARHWPEATRTVKLTSKTLHAALAEYGGPAGLAADAEGAAKLRRWSRGLLREAKAAALLESARTTVGVRMAAPDCRRMTSVAREAQRAHEEVRRAQRTLARLALEDEAVRRQAAVVGAATACVLRHAVGCVRAYASGEAYRKAMGLNLKERSSGKFKGRLKLTKRGSSLARRWLYFAALRILQKPPVSAWYQAKKKRSNDEGMLAVVGVLRKLPLALYAVGVRGEEFQLARLFPGRALPRGAGRERAALLGAPPPNPRDLALGRQSRRREAQENGAAEAAPPPVLAPGPTLGSVPTGALSSARVKRT